jgi:hypothetical protein
MSMITEIEFLCAAEDQGKIPEPYPARKLMPEWFKNLSPKVDPTIDNFRQNATIKRCPPFLDALCAGWIIPLAADVEFTSDSGANNVKYKWDFHKTLVENHGFAQVKGNPEEPKPPMKFLNWWAIKIPPGYSMLFVPPLNRPDYRFECLSGIVDDGYMGTEALEYINFPFFFKASNYSGIIKAGTPLVQCIPFKRDEVFAQARTIKIGTLNEEDWKLINKTRERRNQSYYRNELWERK